MQMLGFRVLTAVSVMAAPAALGIAPAHAAPPLPGFCAPATVVDAVCTVRLASVTADMVDGTITGAPMGGGEAITLAGQQDAYLKSAGFVVTPDPVRDWDSAIDRTANLSVDPSDPAWYGNGKARTFLTRTLNGLATHFPADSLLVRFTSDDSQPGSFHLVSIQPTPRP